MSGFGSRLGYGFGATNAATVKRKRPGKPPVMPPTIVYPSSYLLDQTGNPLRDHLNNILEHTNGKVR